jgi:hypothetical protein
MRTPNVFEDPAGQLAPYAWQINHAEEDESGVERQIEHSANTANTGLVRQQGDDSPLTFEYSGTILHRAQLVAMLAWYRACRTRTIYFHDFAGDSYEVLITAFKPTRQRTLRNPRDRANAPLWFWRYKLTMEVVRIIDGPYAEAGITA